MTDLKQRARDLLTNDDLRGRVPEEVQQFLRDFVSMEQGSLIKTIGESFCGALVLNPDYEVSSPLNTPRKAGAKYIEDSEHD